MKQTQQEKKSYLTRNILKFYQEELYRIVNILPRNKPFYSAMIILRHLIILFFSLQRQFSQLIRVDSNFTFLKNHGFQDFMENDQMKTYFRLILLALNGIILSYFIFTFAIYIFNLSLKSKQIQERSMLNRIYSNEENKNEKINQIQSLFSFLTIAFQNILYVPSVFISLHEIARNPLAITLLIVSILLNLLISDVDYNYEIKSIDYLARPFSYFQFIFSTVIELCFFVAISQFPSSQSILIAVYFMISGLISSQFCQFYHKQSQFINAFSHISFSIVSIIVQIGISFKIPDMLISILTVVYLPISLKIAETITKSNCENILEQLQSLVHENGNQDIDLNKIIRLNLFQDIAYSRDSERREVKLLNVIINTNIDFSNSVFEFQSLQKQQQTPDKLQKINNLNQGKCVVSSSLNQQTEFLNDTEYMNLIKERIKIILKEQFKKMLKEKKRNKQTGCYEMLIFFVFLIEIAQSFKTYWLQFLELSRNTNLSSKQIQMFNSVHSIFLKKRSVLRKQMGRSNPFDCSYLEVIVFEKRLEQSYILLDLTIKIKLEILNTMKQREIKVQDLIKKIELMQQFKNELKDNLNSLCSMNDDSLDLLNIQALFLENLAFSEKDINLMQINKFKKKYQSKLRHKYLDKIFDDEIISSTINKDRFDERTCIVFATYKDQKTLIINQVSSNFQDIFFFTSNIDVKGRSIDSIIPFVFQFIHQKYIESYLDEEVRCSVQQEQSNKNSQIISEHKNLHLEEEMLDEDKKSNEEKITEMEMVQLNKNKQIGCKMNQQIIFTQINQLFILPVRIDLRVNQYYDESTFGLTAKIKHINYQYDYILYEERNLSVIGLTDRLYYAFFPNKESLSKIQIDEVFPFIVGTKNQDQNKDKKNEIHANLTESIENILKQQKEKKNKQKINFIVIQLLDQYAGTQYTSVGSFASSKISNLKAKKVKTLKSMYIEKDLSCYQFTFVQFTIQKVQYRGIEEISYIEIQKMRQLNPNDQAPFILSQLKNPQKKEIYEMYFEINSDLDKVISQLEQKVAIFNLSPQQNFESSSLQVVSAINALLEPQGSSNNFVPKEGSSSINLQLQEENKAIKSNLILGQEVINEQEEDEKSEQGNTEYFEQKLNQKNQNLSEKQQNNNRMVNTKNILEINHNIFQQQNMNCQDQNLIHSLQDIQQQDHIIIDNQLISDNLDGGSYFSKNNNNYQNQSIIERSPNNEISTLNQNTFYNNHLYNEMDEVKIQQSINKINKLNTTNDEASRIGLLNKQQKQQIIQSNSQRSILNLLSPISSEKTQNQFFSSPRSNEALSSYTDKNNLLTITSFSQQDFKFISPRTTQQSIQNLVEINDDKNCNLEIKQNKYDSNLKLVKNALKLSPKYDLKSGDKSSSKRNYFNFQNENYQPAPRNIYQNPYGLSYNKKIQNKEDFSTITPHGNNYYNNQTEDKNIKKQKVQDIQYEIASTNSRNSSSASAKRQLQQIMADKSLLQVIKAINIVGILCFSVMICLTWIQYIQTINKISSSYYDYQVFNWPTKYQSYLSSVVKYQNMNYLFRFSTELKFDDQTQKQLFRNQTRSKQNFMKIKIINLIAQMERANTERKMFKLLRNTYFTYMIGQSYDLSQISNTSSNPSQLVSIPYNTTLQYGVVMSFSNIFRSFSSSTSRNGTSSDNSSTSANSRAEYYMISNEQQQLKSLKYIQDQIVTQQEYEQHDISNQLTILMVLIVTINGFCVSIILPLYYYIQKERDVIISLFATFSTSKLDQLIKSIQMSYYKQKQLSICSNRNSQSMNQTFASLQSISKEKDVRKQNISSITKLPRFNSKISMIVFFIYLLIICYPIIIKIFTQDYLTKTTLDLLTMKKIYELRSYLLENIAMNFNVIVMKIKPGLKPMPPELYYDYLNELNQQQQVINANIQWIVNSQYQKSRYNQNLYDSFFFAAFKNNLCNVFQQYPQFNTNQTQLNTTICSITNNGFLQQGFEVAYKQTLYLFSDLYKMYTIPNNQTSMAQVSQFLSTFNIIDYIAYTEFLDEVIVSLNQFILTQNDNFYQQIVVFQIILIAIQIVIMALVFTLGWISFSKYLNNTLHKTKTYLQILDINTLIENTYILTYIKKNSTI